MKLRWFILMLGTLGVFAGCRLPSSPKAEFASEKANAKVTRNAVVQAGLVEPAEEDGLNRAAECVEKGDIHGAIGHLEKHIRRYPEQIMIRAYLAELLLKCNQLPAAQDQFERFIAAAQESDGPARGHLVHSHTRLVEIAQRRDDDYGEHLHRGIGMVLLVRQLETSGAAQDEAGFRERMLCKAAGELTKASRHRPEEPRPHWYLVEVWTKLNQPQSIAKALRHAKDCASLLPLPSAEQRALVLAR